VQHIKNTIRGGSTGPLSLYNHITLAKKKITSIFIIKMLT
jgi:hypothetical protein